MKNRRIIAKIIGVLLTGVVLATSVTPGTVKAEEGGATVPMSELNSFAGINSLWSVTYSAEECLQALEDTKNAYWGYFNLGLCHTEKGNLNVRKEPSTSGKLVGKMRNHSVCEVIDTTEDGWAHIISGEVEGYVSLDYLYTGLDAKLAASEYVETVAVVTAEALKVRDIPSTDGAVLTSVPQGEELEVIEELDGWVKVSIDGEEGYVCADYVEVGESLETAITLSELLYGQGVSDLRVDMVEYAKQFLGNPYVWGGTSLTKGCDCSGFTMAIYKHFGITLEHYSGTQANSGTKIKESELQPGDLVFYANSSGTINHVAMYIGGGQVIHASSPKTGIKISKLKYRTPVKYVRILTE